jgi:hypothetical protein
MGSSVADLRELTAPFDAVIQYQPRRSRRK